MSDLEFRLILDHKLSIYAVWQKLAPIIRDEIQIDAPYLFISNDKLEVKEFEEIDEYLSIVKNESYFCLSSADDSGRHSFEYQSTSQQVSIHCMKSDLIQGVESLSSKLAQNFSFSNMRYRQENEKSYFLKAFETEWYQPGKHNLFMMPAFYNERDFYIEGVTAEMWFGESFWQYASCSREELVACDWLETEEKGNGVLYVKAYHKEFDEAEGEQLACLLYTSPSPRDA